MLTDVLKKTCAKTPALMPGFGFLPRWRASICLGLVAIFSTSAFAQAFDLRKISSPPLWHNLAPPAYLWPHDGAIYYTLTASNGSKVHLVVADMKSGKWTFQPAINKETMPTSEVAIMHNASAAINGGFFNLSDGVSTSYVVIDKQEEANPHENNALSENPRLKQHLETIYNRSEVRFLEDVHGKSTIQIALHHDPRPKDTKLIHSLQAGPRLLPMLGDRTEAFVRPDPDGKETDSIGSNKPAARTAFGITPDGYAILACVAGPGQDANSVGLTLKQVSQFMQNLGCSEAINFDGGTSSTMFVRLVHPSDTSHSLPGQLVCSKSPETQVKSVLLLLPAKK